MKKLLMTTSILAFAVAYDNQAGWKLDADGKVEMKDGNPIFINAEGKEMTVRGDTVTNLNKENKEYRERAEKAEKDLKVFDGLDVEKAKKALETVSQLDAKTLIDAGKVDEVKAQITQQYEVKMGEKDKAIAERDSKINNMMIDGVFANSDFIRDSVAMPRDFFTSTMRNHFSVEEGKVVVKDKSGNPVYSKQNVGELATPDEALRLLVEQHPQKDTILRADAGAGSGSGGKGGNSGLGRSMTRREFDAIESPAKKAEIAAKVGKGEMNLVD